MYKRLMTQFDYSMVEINEPVQLGPLGQQLPARKGIETTLVRLKDGAIKKFYLAGAQDGARMDALGSHMNSLTDDQCGSFYEDAKYRKPKKAQDAKA